jgi:hypothetical protein
MLNILQLKLTFTGYQSVIIQAVSWGVGKKEKEKKKQHSTYFNLSLSSIRRMVLQNLDSNNLIGAFLPALYNL